MSTRNSSVSPKFKMSHTFLAISLHTYQLWARPKKGLSTSWERSSRWVRRWLKRSAKSLSTFGSIVNERRPKFATKRVTILANRDQNVNIINLWSSLKLFTKIELSANFSVLFCFLWKTSLCRIKNQRKIKWKTYTVREKDFHLINCKYFGRIVGEIDTSEKLWKTAKNWTELNAFNCNFQLRDDQNDPQKKWKTHFSWMHLTLAFDSLTK